MSLEKNIDAAIDAALVSRIVGCVVLVNQDGKEVCSFLRTFYVYKQGAEQLQGIFPEGETPLTLDD